MGQPALGDNELYYTDMPVGEILRRTRSHYGQSLPDIERALRIRASQIEAIENNQIEKLPGRVYAIGFVRSYSEYLGLDGDKMVHLFKVQSGGGSASPQLHFPATASESKTPPVWIVGASALAAVVIVAGWWFVQHQGRALVTEIPEVPAEMRADAEGHSLQGEIMGPMPPPDRIATMSQEETIAPTAQSPQEIEPAAGETAAASAREGIILNITQNSWVEIRDQKGATIVSRVLKEGDQYYVPDRPDLSMSLGNAGGVQLEVDGQSLSPLGNVGEVRRNISLDAAFLKKNYAKTVESKTE